ncbi:MAG: hypothetical protein H6613_07175 [Ignavibacteriales bacterium]|nr:hypothetical protein [Ignavibacteriales bacterium]
MGGKAILLVILAFSMMFTVVNFNSSNTTTRAVENLSEYYSKTNLQNIAASGANMAANLIFQDPTWSGSFNKLPFQGGYIDINVTNFAVDKIKITSTAYLNGIYGGEIKEDTALIKIVLEPSSFSEYGYYANIWGSGYLVTGDTVDGPFHTQDQLNTLGSPVFLGKVTTKKGVNSVGDKWGFGPANPEFLGGYSEESVNVPFDLKPDKIKAAGNFDGKVFEDKITGKALDVKLVFEDDGSSVGVVKWSTKKPGHPLGVHRSQLS